LGSTLLDALYFGLPIMASNVDGIPDVIDDGVNGILVEPEQPDAIVDALDSLLGDAQKLQAIRDRYIEKARQYDVRQMANAYLAVYEAL
jgi:glycosyltransferase involved in cell wall biosynthesis